MFCGEKTILDVKGMEKPHHKLSAPRWIISKAIPKCCFSRFQDLCFLHSFHILWHITVINYIICRYESLIYRSKPTVFPVMFWVFILNIWLFYWPFFANLEKNNFTKIILVTNPNAEKVDLFYFWLVDTSVIQQDED